MKVWKIARISTFDDDKLANKITEIDSVSGQKVQQVIYMGDNSQHVRIYQILYTIE